MIGDKVTVWFNGELVVDNVVLENYWEREKPIYPREQIELKTTATSCISRTSTFARFPGRTSTFARFPGRKRGCLQATGFKA